MYNQIHSTVIAYAKGVKAQISELECYFPIILFRNLFLPLFFFLFLSFLKPNIKQFKVSEQDTQVSGTLVECQSPRCRASPTYIELQSSLYSPTVARFSVASAILGLIWYWFSGFHLGSLDHCWYTVFSLVQCLN